MEDTAKRHWAQATQKKGRNDGNEIIMIAWHEEPTADASGARARCTTVSARKDEEKLGLIAVQVD